MPTGNPEAASLNGPGRWARLGMLGLRACAEEAALCWGVGKHFRMPSASGQLRQPATPGVT